MANYVTHTSDKKKKTALVFWAVGLIGILGLEYLYVGKIKTGIIRLVIGSIVLMAFYGMKGAEGEVPMSIVFWVVVAVPNLVRILLGTFRDNVGAPIRK